MRPPNPCDPLKELVDRLKEQLDVLCSQSPEHLFLQSLIDLPGLTNMTRTMLKDAETRLANCRQHPVPPSNGPFLVTLNCPRRIIKTDHARMRATLCKQVAACAGIGMLALSLSYARYEDRVVQSLVAQNKQELASFNATRSQLDGLQARIKTLDARSELPSTPAADAIGIHPTDSRRPGADGSGLKAPKLLPRTQRKVVEERHSDLSAPHNNLRRTPIEPTGSTAGTPSEAALSQTSREHDYHEFDIDKSKQFQNEGPLGIRLKKADTKHQYADLELMVNDQNLSQKRVNLYQLVMFYGPDSSQPVKVVIDNISNDHIHGYVTAPEYRQTEPTSRSSNTSNTAPQFRSVAAERHRVGARWRGFSVNKILSRLKLRSDS